jgi:NAD(P)-dependent dehydrogenase (short-subunit alcohol dehydrogenase family)
MKNIFNLKDKVVFITGGAGLLGKMHAEAILEHGGRVVIAD